MAETDSRTGVGELTVLLSSWLLHLKASNPDASCLAASRSCSPGGLLLAANRLRANPGSQGGLVPP
jgi:hypothetical protein